MESKRSSQAGRIFNAGLFIGLVGCIAGCAVGPDYKKPDVWSPPQWNNPAVKNQSDVDRSLSDSRQGKDESQLVAAPMESRWWRLFNDAELNHLIDRVATQNLDVQMASARIEESRASLAVTGSAQYPSLNGAALYSRTQPSSKFAQRASRSIAGPEVPTSQRMPEWNVLYYGVDAMWEADLWGRVRRDVESGEAGLQQSEEERRGVLIAQMAEVARDYLALRGYQTQLRIVMENQSVAQEQVNLTQARYNGGLTTDLDVENARSQLENTQSQIPQLQQQIRSLINALGLLLGAPPQALAGELNTPHAVPPLPPQVPVGLPSALAERRPDIRESDAKLHEATANVGEAMAEFYPRIILNGNLGFQALSFRDLGFWDASTWNIGPIITIPFFQGGKLRGQLKLAEATQKEAALSYRKTVLNAWKEIDDAMDAYVKEQKRHERLNNTVEANKAALALAHEQYRHGTQTFLNVLDAQRRVLASELDLSNSTTTLSTNLVRLYNALGGGWETSYPLKSSG